MHPMLWTGYASAVVVYLRVKAHDLRAVGKGINLLCTATFRSCEVEDERRFLFTTNTSQPVPQ
jgi:hypothetical protein